MNQKIAPIVAALCLCASSASAGIIELSTYSLDQTDPEVLDATIVLSVVDNELTLTVTNETTTPDEYLINKVFFNGGDDVTGLAMTSGPPGWSLAFDQKVGAFGTFDFALLGGEGEHPENLRPGHSASFVFDIFGSASEADFMTASSSRGYLAAVKFVAGHNSDSATGAVRAPVPAPGALALLCIAAGLTARSRQRR